MERFAFTVELLVTMPFGIPLLIAVLVLYTFRRDERPLVNAYLRAGDKVNEGVQSALWWLLWPVARYMELKHFLGSYHKIVLEADWDKRGMQIRAVSYITSCFKTHIPVPEPFSLSEKVGIYFSGRPLRVGNYVSQVWLDMKDMYNAHCKEICHKIESDIKTCDAYAELILRQINYRRLRAYGTSATHEPLHIKETDFLYELRKEFIRKDIKAIKMLLEL